MARRSHTYAIRLAVEGGGQVKAELVSVGQSGEQSLKRLETAGGRASGGLKGLGRQAELLRTGIRTLGGALIGAATVGGLGALIDRSISAADAIGKTADKIGVGVEALQELRFAAKASGVEQQTLDMALQRFTRRAAEAADVAGKAGIAWERLFDAPEEKSLRTLRYELDLASSTIEKLEGRIRELRESPSLGFTTFLDTAQINALQTKIDELRRARDQTQARIAFLQGPPDTGAPAPASAPTPDDTAGVQDRAKNLERIARELEGTLFNITHEGSARIIAEHERRVAEIEALRARDGSNAEAVDQLIVQSAAVRDAQLSQLRAKEG